MFYIQACHWTEPVLHLGHNDRKASWIKSGIKILEKMTWDTSWGSS